MELEKECVIEEEREKETVGEKRGTPRKVTVGG
jgi:hypothetical protein